MIYKENENEKIELMKKSLGLSGDVYYIEEGHLLESLESHKKMFPNSKVRSIKSAEQERLEFISKEKEELRRLAEENKKEEEALPEA